MILEDVKVYKNAKTKKIIALNAMKLRIYAKNVKNLIIQTKLVVAPKQIIVKYLIMVIVLNA